MPQPRPDINPRHQLRREWLQKRRDLCQNEWKLRSAKLKEHFFDWYTPDQADVLHIFLPIIKHNEPYTWHIIRHLWGHFNTKKVVVPVSDFATFKMHTTLLLPGTPVADNAYGIPEPLDYKPIAPHNIDLVLVPLAAADQQGYRLGYGKGFYDRFLPTCRPGCLRIGLHLFDQLLPQIPNPHPHDVALNGIITPNKGFRWF